MTAPDLPMQLPVDAGLTSLTDLSVGDTIRLHADAKTVVDTRTPAYSDFGCIPVYGEAIQSAVEWQSTNPAVATVDDQGVLVAQALGRDTVLVHVVAVDQTTALPVDVSWP